MQSCVEQQSEVDVIILVKNKKGSKKRFRKKDGTKVRTKKDLSKAMWFRCHKMLHYERQYFLKGKGVKKVAVGTVASVEEMTSQFETTFC